MAAALVSLEAVLAFNVRATISFQSGVSRRRRSPLLLAAKEPTAKGGAVELPTK
jgi:hypothetical protein